LLRRDASLGCKLGRIRIAAECARLESVYRETYRGFKSLILRHPNLLSLYVHGLRGGM
jgi:hypothetical protein